MNTHINLTEIESAINFWRLKHPSVGEEMRLCAQASALANHYALMIVSHQTSIPLDALDPDARLAFEAWASQHQSGGR